MTIAVTGATGHLGRLVLTELLDSHPADSLVAIVRDQAKATDLAEKGINVQVAEYADSTALQTALEGVDTLLLISSSEIGQRFPQHKNIIDAAAKAGVKRLVYTSAPKATTSALVLAPEHKATEEYLATAGIPFTVLRNNWYTENYLQQLDTARTTGTIVAAAGDGRVASATRADLAAAAAVVLTTPGHDGKVYEVGGDTAWNYHDLAAAISEIIGAEVVYTPVDAVTLTGILTGAGLDDQTAGFVAALDQNTADGLLAETTGELSALIGRPTTSLVDGLREALGT